MGGCFWVKKPVPQLALKLPGGTKYIEYNRTTNKWEEKPDIQDWLKTRFSPDKKWKYSTIYNDDNGKKTYNGGGHCKGIVVWNKRRIGWLCHSVPKFPYVSEDNSWPNYTILPSELLFGQSFYFIEMKMTYQRLFEIHSQLYFMHAHIYQCTSSNNVDGIREWKIHSGLSHISKSPDFQIDVYSEYLTRVAPSWNVETWRRGNMYPTEENSTKKKIWDVQECTWNNQPFSCTRDHSKWAVSNNQKYFWFGDLNRMTTQQCRGGGGFLNYDSRVAQQLHTIIVPMNELPPSAE
jgi:hypothetical protein